MPKAQYTREIDKTNQTIKFDQGLNHNRAPDIWLEKQLDNIIDYDKLSYIFFDKKKKPLINFEPKPPKPVKPKYSELRLFLRDINNYKDIKEMVSVSNKTVIESKKGQGILECLPRFSPIM